MKLQFTLLTIFAIVGFSAFAAADAPQNVQASDGTFSNYVLVTFEPVANATQYLIYASTIQAQEQWFVVGNTTATYQWIFNAVPGTIYNYRVYPVGQYVNNAEYSARDRGHRSGTPNDILNLTAYSMTNNRIGIDWNPPADGWTYFALYRSIGTGGPGCEQFYRRSVHPWFTDNTVQTGVTYSYSVRAVTPQGRSACSPIGTAMPGI